MQLGNTTEVSCKDFSINNKKRISYCVVSYCSACEKFRGGQLPSWFNASLGMRPSNIPARGSSSSEYVSCCGVSCYGVSCCGVVCCVVSCCGVLWCVVLCCGAGVQ